MKQSCVYLIRNRVNGKVYVGKTNNAQHRWSQHVSASRKSHHHMPVVRALKKYGPRNFTFEVLENFDSENAALRAEVRWISYYESNDRGKGYNLDKGGLGGKTFSAATRAKLSLALRGRKLSPEHVAKMSASLKGRKLSPETKAKMSAAKLGRKRPPGMMAKLAKRNRGRKHTPEAIANMSEAHKGKRYGK